MKQSDPGRGGRSNYAGADEGTLVWKWRTSGRVPNLAVDRFGKIFLGSMYSEPVWSGDDYVTVLYPEGTVFWRLKVPSYPWGFAQGANSAPALDTNSNAVYNNPNSHLTRFGQFGDVQLQLQGNSGSTNDSAPALLGSGTIFHHQFGVLRKYSPDGQVLFARGVSSLTDVAVNQGSGESAMGGIRSSEPHGSTDLTYINADGTIRWIRTSLRGVQATPTIAPDGIVYCNLNDTMAITRDNVTLWSQPGGGVRSPLTLGITGEVFRFVSNTIQSLNISDGAIRWTQQVTGEVAGPMAVDNRGFLYATTRAGYAVKINPANGAFVFNSQICTEFTNGPAISNDKSIVVPGKEGFVNYVFKVK